MKFAVVWLSELHDLLARLYLRARADGNSAAVTRAVDEIDRRLRTAPADEGESRAGTTRVLIVPPVTVEYEIHEDEGIVIVTDVHYYPPKP